MPGPFKPDLAPAGKPPHNPKQEEVPNQKIKDLLAKADREEQARKAKNYAKIIGQGISSEAISELAEHLGHLTGVGTLLTSGKHFIAAESTQQHLDELQELSSPAYLLEKCTCGQCEVLVNYAIEQKESKLYRRLAKAMPIPFGSSVIRLGEAARGAYKKWVTKNRGVRRRQNACVLWICAKYGCPVAKALMEELLGGIPEVIEAVNSYYGIIQLAEKLKST
jgi:hypothetical protein